MKHTETPATRLATESIISSFQMSHKRHLFLTGKMGSGKSTLLQALKEYWNVQPGITTKVLPGECVLLQENGSAAQASIGIFDPASVSSSNRMQPQEDGFLKLGIPALERAMSTSSPWVSIDEIGYLESSCLPFQQTLQKLLDTKRVLAVLRKQDTDLLNMLRNHPDAYVYDLDHPVESVGCVIMASGEGKRFGGNKLLAPFHGKALLNHILDTTSSVPFPCRIVVTRHTETASLCEQNQIPVLLHNLPGRNDTIRLGLQSLLYTHPSLAGCMFIPGDQPLLSSESIETMLLTYSRLTQDTHSHSSELPTDDANHRNNTAPICRLSFDGQAGAPILFDKSYFLELLALPEGKGGSLLAKKYPEQVHLIPAREAYELYDVDTPEDLLRLSP